MLRKEFLKTCGLAIAGAVSLPVVLASCASNARLVHSTSTKDRITVKKTEFIPEAEKPNSYVPVIVSAEHLQLQIFVSRFGDNEFVALPMECTHRGCQLQQNLHFLVCPCHGSEFTDRGVVQNPPAEKDLTPFKVTTDNENIYIHL